MCTSGSKKGGVDMEVIDTRQRSRLLLHDCKAHMIIDIQEGSCAMIYFVEEHTHKMM
jgi:hypothetical protein